MPASGGVASAGCAGDRPLAVGAASSSNEGAVPSALPANPDNGRHTKVCDLCGIRIGDRWCKSRRFPNRYWCEPCRHATWDDYDPVHMWYVVTADDVSGSVGVAPLGEAGESGNAPRPGSPSHLMHANASCSPGVSPVAGRPSSPHPFARSARLADSQKAQGAHPKRSNRRHKKQRQHVDGVNSSNGGEPSSPPSPTLTAHRPSGRVGQAAFQRKGELGAVYVVGRG